MYLKMPHPFLLSIFFTFIMLLGTIFANEDACGVTDITITELIHPTEATKLHHVEPTDTLVTSINESGNSPGHCPSHDNFGPHHQCGLPHPNSTTTDMTPITGAASSASESEASNLTTFDTHKVSAPTNVGQASSSTSTSSATYVAKSISTPCLIRLRYQKAQLPLRIRRLQLRPSRLCLYFQDTLMEALTPTKSCTRTMSIEQITAHLTWAGIKDWQIPHIMGSHMPVPTRYVSSLV
ncbi:hypothetical protein N7486_001539 [Penicillium sp. IBT 16267x]|nr:hypothetical protein N7486_001539 [Penicillium sp. IBT 16267x]